MKSVLVIVLFCFSLSVIAQPQQPRITAESVIKQSIERMGGAEYLRSIRTLHTELATTMDGRDVVWVIKEALPNKGVFKIIYQGNVMYENRFNGVSGVEVVNGQVRDSDPSDFADKLPRRNIFNELDYLDSSLYTVKMLPEENEQNEPCYVISATFINGDNRKIYVSKRMFQTIREDKSSNMSPDKISTTRFKEFQTFGKLTFYSVMEMGADKPQIATVSRILINEKVSAADFEKP